ncbi:phage tail protein [Photorhabdus laumondii]|uniref:phage tail protein n=1 Tax=Photorhabdus laumondii TaxID=2218628 RepID=UPI0025B0FFF0|nr:phage tail protein [Photorhabdus laumondii]
MSQKNDFKAFSISDNANIVSQEKYEESQNLKTGFPPENVSTHVLNKVLRQSSTISSVVANFIATQSGEDVLDDGDIAKLTVRFNRALDKALEQKISGISSIPVGSPIPWPLSHPPSGYFTCNGSAFSRSQYPKLAEAYPDGRLPDLRGEFIRGWDDGRGVDSGRKLLSWQESTIITKHLGEYTDGVGLGVYYIDGVGYREPSYHRYKIPSLESIGIDVNFYRLRPRNIAFNYLVKAE